MSIGPLRKLGTVIDCLDGQRKPVNAKDRSKRSGDVPYYGAMGQVGVIDEALFNEPLVLIGEDGVPFLDSNKHKSYLISGPSWVNNHAHVVRPHSNVLDQRFLVHYLNQFDFRGFVNGTTRLKLTQGAMRQIPVPIPTLEKQIQIVDFLEEQLSHLDAGVRSLEMTKERLNAHRIALLKAAVSGNLISEHPILSEYAPTTWKRYRLDELGKWSSGGTPTASSKKYYSGTIPWAVIGDLNEGDVYQTAKSITDEALKNSSAKILPASTLMLAMYGASIGRTGRMGVPMATNQAIACLQPNENLIDSDFMLYWLQSNKHNFISAGKGGAQPNISQTIIKSWEIELPPIYLQKMIVEMLREQLGSNSRLVSEVSRQQILTSTLRKALLNAAFTGQLTKESANV